VHTPLTSYYEHNKITRLRSILSRLNECDVALVSDAGTPGLNDPGFELVGAAVQAGHRVSVIPGPAAPIAALVSSGLPADSFLYIGYLPRKAAERRAALGNVAGLPYTIVMLETPHRLQQALRDMQELLGDRRVAIARELTKLHEEIWRGTLDEAVPEFEQPRGEFVIVVGPPTVRARRWSEGLVRDAIRERMATGQSPTSLAADLAEETGWPRRAIYKLAIGLE
jgi:16S rRNA (cytidine1402-2'-O)-methyltransferase